MKTILTIALITAGSCLAADNPVALNAKPGLWETTTVTERTGMPPIPADTLAKMPAEQRARIEAQIKAMSGTQTTTQQSCITQEHMAKGFAWNSKSLDKSCRQTITNPSGSEIDMKWEYDGQNKNTGTAKIRALDSTHVNAVIEVTAGPAGRVMNMKITNTGKWLSNSCGDVKPDNDK